MHWLHFSFTITLIVSSAYGVPVEHESRSIEKRITACGTLIELRDVGAKACNPNPDNYFFNPGSPIAEKSATRTRAGVSMPCEHIVELQLLKNVLENGGVCAELQKSTAANADKLKLVQPIINAINAKENLVFCDKRINDNKKGLVQRSFGSKKSATAKVDAFLIQAVDSYITQTENSSENKSKQVAANVDAAIKTAFPNLTPTKTLSQAMQDVITFSASEAALAKKRAVASAAPSSSAVAGQKRPAPSAAPSQPPAKKPKTAPLPVAPAPQPIPIKKPTLPAPKPVPAPPAPVKKPTLPAPKPVPAPPAPVKKPTLPAPVKKPTLPVAKKPGKP